VELTTPPSAMSLLTAVVEGVERRWSSITGANAPPPPPPPQRARQLRRWRRGGAGNLIGGLLPNRWCGRKRQRYTPPHHRLPGEARPGLLGLWGDSGWDFAGAWSTSKWALHHLGVENCARWTVGADYGKGLRARTCTRPQPLPSVTTGEVAGGGGG